MTLNLLVLIVITVLWFLVGKQMKSGRVLYGRQLKWFSGEAAQVAGWIVRAILIFGFFSVLWAIINGISIL